MRACWGSWAVRFDAVPHGARPSSLLGESDHQGRPTQGRVRSFVGFGWIHPAVDRRAVRRRRFLGDISGGSRVHGGSMRAPARPRDLIVTHWKSIGSSRSLRFSGFFGLRDSRFPAKRLPPSTPGSFLDADRVDSPRHDDDLARPCCCFRRGPACQLRQFQHGIPPQVALVLPWP